MSLKLFTAAGVVSVPIWVNRTYRAAGRVTDLQAAGSACDIILFTAAAAGTTRITKAKFRLTGGGTASSAAGDLLQMLRVVAAPTGQINVPVVLTQHDPSDAAPGSTVSVTPSTTQTPGTTPTVLGQSNFSLSLQATGGDLFNSIDVEFPAGTESEQEPIVVPAGHFVTFRPATAIPSNSVIDFDLTFSED